MPEPLQKQRLILDVDAAKLIRDNNDVDEEDFYTFIEFEQ